MFKKILIALVVIVVVCVAVVAMQPADYSVTRSLTMKAPASDVYAQVNDFHNWEAWSPWAKLDPNSKMTFEGPSAGPGAVCKWSGDDKVGEGSMTILESKPGELVRIKLDFVKPFEDTSTTEFTFTPKDEQTTVKWTMSGTHGFLTKAFYLFMDMDKMLGGDFEKGLEQMKAIVEARKSSTPEGL